MVYQMTIYYGALLDGKTVYSMSSTFVDCTKFPEKLNEELYRDVIVERIKADGFDPNDFEIGFLTENQYEDRLLSDEEEKTNRLKIFKEAYKMIKNRLSKILNIIKGVEVKNEEVETITLNKDDSVIVVKKSADGVEVHLKENPSNDKDYDCDNDDKDDNDNVFDDIDLYL